VDPERGTRVKDSYNWHKAQDWAEEYCAARGWEFCPERRKSRGKRAPSPPRPVWKNLSKLQPEAVAEAFAQVDQILVDYTATPKIWKEQEWLRLKAQLKAERLAFFGNGKEAYRNARNSIYRQVRTEFRGEWKQYYQLRRHGLSAKASAELRV